MLVPLKWLRDYVDIDVDTQEFADMMTMTGSKVEKVEFYGKETNGVEVCKILEIEQHPDADRLKVTKVEVANGEVLQIVTNATNYSGFRKLIETFPDTEVTISLPIPPNEKYISSFKSISGAIDEKGAFSRIIDSIEYMIELGTSFKINYVLCKDINTSNTYIKEIIEYAKRYPCIQLRFLETVVNSTNNQNDRMNRYVFSQSDFEKVLCELGYIDSVNNKLCDKRSSSIYNLDGCNVKFIKFFCNHSCEECPEDKTSLWLTSTGTLKKCAYRNHAINIDNWTYDKIVKQLEDFI